MLCSTSLLSRISISLHWTLSGYRQSLMVILNLIFKSNSTVNKHLKNVCCSSSIAFLLHNWHKILSLSIASVVCFTCDSLLVTQAGFCIFDLLFSLFNSAFYPDGMVELVLYYFDIGSISLFSLLKHLLCHMICCFIFQFFYFFTAMYSINKSDISIGSITFCFKIYRMSSLWETRKRMITTDYLFLISLTADVIWRPYIWLACAPLHYNILYTISSMTCLDKLSFFFTL